MKYLLLTIISSLLWMAQPAFSAEEAKCTCDHKCAETCKKDEPSKTCDCKACDCAKTGECPHHQCGDHAEKKEKPKK